MREMEEEQRRIHDLQREHEKEVELLRAANQQRARDNRGDALSPPPARHDADPIWERRGGSPERVNGAARSASPPPARWSTSPPASSPPPGRSAVSPPPAQWGQDAPNIASWSTAVPSSSVGPARSAASPSPAPWGAEPPNIAPWTTTVPSSSTAPAQSAPSPSPVLWGAESPNIASWSRPTTASAAEDPAYHSAEEQGEYDAHPVGSAEGGAVKGRWDRPPSPEYQQ